MSQIERAPTASGKRFLSDQGLAKRYGRSPRTIKRWKKKPALKFPPPDLIVNGNEYREEGKVEAWERERATTPIANDEEN